MAVYYKFKSAKDFYSIPIEGQFISVASLKEKIFRSNRYGRGMDFDLMISNAQTDEEYVDGTTMIPKNTSVLIKRLPGVPRNPIIAGIDKLKVIVDKLEDVPPSCSRRLVVGDHSMLKYPEESEMNVFGSDHFCIQEVLPAQPTAPKVDISLANEADEDSKVIALVNTPALDWNCQGNYCGAASGSVWRSGGSKTGGCSSGRFGLVRTPPVGYVCHRCNLPGHFIQHCPTNGDPDYDSKRAKPPTGIPISVPGSAVVLKPNKTAFEKETERSVLTSCVNDVPPELRCPFCKEVMKDAVITGKCCFKSFCDMCIRSYISTESKCFCGATNISADYLIPNATIRETICRILDSRTSSAEKSGSSARVRDAQSSLVDHSGEMQRQESPNDSLLTKKQPEKGTTSQVKELPKSMTAEVAASVKEAVVEKKRRKKRVSGSTETEYGLGGLPGYNNYNWVGNEGYLSPFSITNPYAGQCYYYYNQSNWDLAELWMNGVSFNDHVRKGDVKRKPDIEHNKCYRNREKSCQRNREAATAGGCVNGSLLKAKSGMMSQIIWSDMSDCQEESAKLTNTDLHVGPSHELGQPSPSPRIEKNGRDKVLHRPRRSSSIADHESSEDERHFKRRRKSFGLELGAESTPAWHSSTCQVQVLS